MKLTINIDGGARGNPGPAGAGVVVKDEAGTALLEAGYFVGRATNNVAEYTALLRGLDAAQRLGGQRLEIFSDSELMVKQINGEYRVKNETLQDLFEKAYKKLRGFENWQMRHVRREMNSRADYLANKAMDAGRDVVEMEELTGPGRPSAPSTAAPPSVRVVATCVNEPGDVCPAPCREGDAYTFERTFPANVCLHAAAPLAEAAGECQKKKAPAAVDCPHQGCKARFELRSN